MYTHGNDDNSGHRHAMVCSPFLVLQGVSVEAVDPVFQAKMLDMLKQTGRWGQSLADILTHGA